MGITAIADRWRYVADDGVSASFGLAADEYMAQRPTGDPVLRLYSYRSHCALIGRFQRLDAEVHRQYCDDAGITLNRRATGGGAILMGQDQLGLAITIPAAHQSARPEDVRELFRRYSRGLTEGLATLGIDASFHRKNDLEVDGRKLAGMGFYFDKSGGLLFHTSLLVDLDIPLMLRVLKTPFEKISDKEIATVADRMTTVRRECGNAIGLDEVRQAIREGYQRALQLELVSGEFTEAERIGIGLLEDDRYATPEWIDQTTRTSETFGYSRVKTPGGLLEVHLTLTGNVTKAVYLTGDFFAQETRVAQVERQLKRVPVTSEAVAQALEPFYRDGDSALPGVPRGRLVRAVLTAAEAAGGATGGSLPKGCFVGAAS